MRREKRSEILSGQAERLAESDRKKQLLIYCTRCDYEGPAHPMACCPRCDPTRGAASSRVELGLLEPERDWLEKPVIVFLMILAAGMLAYVYPW